MKILLIRPHSEIKMQWTNIPLGVGYIASILENSGATVFVKDLMIDGYDRQGLVEFIQSNTIDIVGISCLTIDSYYVKKIIRDIKAESNIPVIVGGPHATVAYEELFESGADYIVIGEGEETIADLIRCIKNQGLAADVKGIAYKENGTIQLTSPRPFMENLDIIPYPAFHLLDMSIYSESAKHTGGYNILSSRGCPADCTFCTKKIFGYKIRKRSPENVVEEIKLLQKQFNINTFCFADDYFLSSNKWVSKFCGLLAENKIKAKFWAQGRVDNKIKMDVYKQMINVGFIGISFGIESGDQFVLDSIGKRITPQMAKEAVKKAKQAGFLMVEAGFILGFPQDTKTSMEKTVRLASEVETTVSHTSFFTSFPGTKIQETLEKDNRIKYETDYRKLNLFTPTLTTDQFTEKDLWKYQDTIIFNKMKNRFMKETAHFPSFILEAIKSEQSLNHIAYMHFPATIKYIKNLKSKLASIFSKTKIKKIFSRGHQS
ncbi:MAG: radical SAM protein [Pseudomonadota bacterium]